MITNREWLGAGGVVFAALLMSATPITAQTRQQTLNLRAGWNAVFLEVEPANPNPSAVFTNMPIDIVARYFPRTSPVQYIVDPSSAPWNESGWGVWYGPTRPESIISSLHSIHGQKAYLVHTTSACTWNIGGTAVFERLSWQADSFNLLGFCIDENMPPTFGRFFAGAGSRIGERIYQLDAEGKWQPVLAAATTIRPGEACWVYCRGKTDYQGPMDVKIAGLGGLDFGGTGSGLDVELINCLSEPATVTLEVVPGGGDLPLSQVLRDVSQMQFSYPELPAVTQLIIGPSQMESFRLQVRRERMIAATQTKLIKITTSHGVRYWMPIRAQRPTLAGQP
jgi:hypothetical protein